jgi:hypothetical protein
MPGRINHFKHTPGMGLAMIFVAGVALFGIPAALVCLVLVINNPWLWIPIVGIACLVIYLRARAIRLHDAAIMEELRQIRERFDREMEEERRRQEQIQEENDRHDREIVAYLAEQRAKRK